MKPHRKPKRSSIAGRSSSDRIRGKAGRSLIGWVVRVRLYELQLKLDLSTDVHEGLWLDENFRWWRGSANAKQKIHRPGELQTGRDEKWCVVSVRYRHTEGSWMDRHPETERVGGWPKCSGWTTVRLEVVSVSKVGRLGVMYLSATVAAYDDI